MFFFVVAPFCSCPASLVSRKVFAVGPGCAKCFFFFALRWAPRPFGGALAKKNTTQGVFFLLRPRGKAGEGEAPLGAGTGPEQKKNTTQGVFFFAAAPAKGKGRRSPRWAPARGQSKKKKAGTGPEQQKNTTQGVFFFCSGPVPAPNGASPSLAFRRGRSKKTYPGWCFFFALAPCRRPTGLLLPLPFPGAKKNTLGGVFFFALAPCRRPTGLLLPLPFAGAAAKKHTLGGVFFFCSGPVPAPNGASPSPAFPRGRSKKKTPWVVLFFAAAPRGRSLTHCGPGWRCLPLAGVVVFFLLRPRPDRAGVFFLLWPRPDAHSLTVGWGDFGKARVVFFFCCGPAGSF